MEPQVATPEQVEVLSKWSTQQWIDHAWGLFSDKANNLERAQYAWAYLQQVRRPGEIAEMADRLGFANAVDQVPGADKFANLANAEHYMFARQVVAATGDVKGETAMILGYEGVKKFKFETDGKKDLKIGRYNPTPPSLQSISWGLKGADDGLKDYQNATGNVHGELGSAIRNDTGLMGKQLNLPPDVQKGIEANLDTAIEMQKPFNKAYNDAMKRLREMNAKIEMLKRMIDIMKKIKGFQPKSPSDSTTACSAQMEPRVEESVSGEILNSGSGAGAGDDPGTAA